MTQSAFRVALTFPVFRILLALSCAAGRPACGEVKPNRLFSENAVLQQGVNLPVWGIANEGEKVTVSIQGQTVSVTANDGRWLTHLKALQPGGPFVMTIAGENTVTLTNVLVGEVWLCSGQSNMEMPLDAAANSAEAIAQARDPQLRFFSVPHEATDEPKRDLPDGCAWREATPVTAKYFSAVGYFFGRYLREARNTPVGLIHSSVGGTPAEAWMPHGVLTADPEFAAILERQAEAVKKYDPAKAAADYKTAIEKAKAEGKDAAKIYEPKSPAVAFGRPSGLYNAMIAPLEPFALAGVVWYQGEQNRTRPREYRRLFPALIDRWRSGWGEGDFPFLFVQIAPFREIPPELREAQLLTWQKTPRTAMVVTDDVGEGNNIHPTHKEPVGARLALAARAIAYGEKIEYSGPVYDSMKIEGDRAILSFTHVGDGLVAQGGELKGFTVASVDEHFVPAMAVIDTDKVIVSSPAVTKPAAVRYGWDNVPDVNLFNRQGLPATPFRTDTR
jgi:sialate O-acetylesterase